MSQKGRRASKDFDHPKSPDSSGSKLSRLRSLLSSGRSNPNPANSNMVQTRSSVSSAKTQDAIITELRDNFKAQNAPTAYASKRSDFVSEEAEVYWDAAARKSASATELKAQDIVFKIRESERRDPDLFGDLPGEALPGQETRDLGGRFLLNKPRIERSRIFEIAREFPKGAHQHVHLNCELQPERLFLRARRPEVVKTFCVRSTVPLCDEQSFRDAEIVFKIVPEHCPKVDLFSKDYSPDKKNLDSTAFMLWSDFRKHFPKETSLDTETEENEALLGYVLDRAELWAREKMIIRREPVYTPEQTHNGIWARFNQGTRAFKGLLGYESVYRWYVGELIDSMVRDRVMYAELRPMLMDKFLPSDDGLRMLGHAEQMQIIIDETEKRKRQHKDSTDELQRSFIGLKVIYCTPRSMPRTRKEQGGFPSCMEIELEDCLKLKMQFPELICGFDLVGAEDRPNSIGFYGDLLEAFQRTCKSHGLDIPFMFHAGETLLDTGGSLFPDNSNLYDSYLLNAKRIGHGYSILKHPQLVQLYKKKNICLELCPLSNELLHLCANIRQHPYPQLLAAGLHCTINGDNPSMYRSSLSHEFYQIMVGDPRMTIHGWKQLAQWSLQHSCLSADDMRKAEALHAKEFEEFCQWVVDTHAVEADEMARKWLPELTQ